ncbi:transposase [Rhodococcus wratislaviensis IFP 2016]|uniref:Transposase n=1 Tax=Rhodococcus opacus M213 TaxID=1129896 RepID=K8XYL2_RHOOP|nr:transposase [Rhodococcus opacus M213]ELB93532.1 transposase [Rhodococcus wratislaviensis IFP 2016]
MKVIVGAEDIDKAQRAITRSNWTTGAKYPKAVAKIVDDADVLRVLPLPGGALGASEHHQPHRIDVATVRLRTKVTKGPRSRTAGKSMAYKLIETARARWRTVNAPQLVALFAGRRAVPQG